MKFLLDANLSPETRDFLAATFNLDMIDLEGNQLGFVDAEIVELAKQEGRTIITFDLDFGEIYYLREPGNIGVIILRLED